MNSGSSAEGCPECGAHVGHREVSATACSLGSDSVPRAEHSRIVEDRNEIEADLIALGAAYTRAMLSYHTMLANLTATQARCTELLEEVRALKAKAVEQDEEIVDLKVQLEMAENECQYGAV